MKKILSVFVIFSLLGCVTAEGAKNLSDYSLCYQHSEPQGSEAQWKVYDNEVKLRESLNCNTHAKAIEESKARDKKRSEALQEMADTFYEIGANQSGRSSQTGTSFKTTYSLDSHYVSGGNRICMYSRGGSKAAHTMPGLGLCPHSMQF
jgi:hypothetical protein